MRRTTEILRNLVLIGLLSCFFSPLIVLHDVKNGVTIGKAFYLISVSGVLLMLTSLKLFQNGKVSDIRVTWTDILVSLYFLFVYIRLLFTDEVFSTNLKFITLLSVTVIYFIVKHFFLKENTKRCDILLIVLLLLGFYQASLGLWQLYGFGPSYQYDYNATGSFFNPAPYAGYLVSILPMGLATYHFLPSNSSWNKILRYLGLLTVLSVLLALPGTLSRSAWIAVVGGVAIIYIHHPNVLRSANVFFKNRTRIITASVLAITIAALMAFGLFNWKKDSALGRLLIWKVSTEIIKDHLLFGVGYTKYTPVYSQYQVSYFRTHQNAEDEAWIAGKGEYAFNEFLLITAETGVVGLLLFAGPILLVITKSFQAGNSTHQQRTFVIGALGGLVSLLIFSFFSYPFSIAPLLLNFYFYLSILSALKDRKPVLHIRWRPNMIVRLMMSLLIAILGIALAKNLNKKYLAMKDWKSASLLKRYGDYSEVVAMMDRLRPVLHDNGAFMFEYGQVLSRNKNYKKAIKALENAAKLTSDPYLFIYLGNCYLGIKNYKKAEESYSHSFYLMPHKFYPRYLLVKLYLEMEERDKAVFMARQIMKMKIKVPSTAIEEIKAEMVELIKLEAK